MNIEAGNFYEAENGKIYGPLEDGELSDGSPILTFGYVNGHICYMWSTDGKGVGKSLTATPDLTKKVCVEINANLFVPKEQ